MAFNFKKNIVVGVSVTPELGLEVAQVDFTSRTVLKYGCRQLAYDNARREIADMDIFKETLQDLLTELQIPKGSEIVLNLPSVVFNVTDYPASLNEGQVITAIEEELMQHPIFQNTEACISAVALPNSTIQMTKVAYTVAQKTMLIEMAMQIKEIGYSVNCIDTSVNSTLNALIYNDRVDTAPDATWVLLLVENNCCRIISMQGRNYVDSFEERISIGEVLGDVENYSTVVGAVNPILKNLPSSRLYVVSKTNIISAKILAEKLVYNAQIIHQEANNFASAPFLNVSSEIENSNANMISLDVIGAAVCREFSIYTSAHFNLFNESLGDVYILEQPPVLKFGSLTLVLSMANMVAASIVFAIIVLVLTVLAIVPITTTISQKQAQVSQLTNDIAKIQAYLDENKAVSSALFDEGDEIRIGLAHNKNVYSYYTIVGTEIPKKLWLTGLSFGKYITIEGQADNLESVYSFLRNIKDYNPNTDIKVQKLAFATNSNLKALTEEEAFDTDSIITSMNADFYEFKISNAPEVVKKPAKTDAGDTSDLMDLEPIE